MLPLTSLLPYLREKFLNEFYHFNCLSQYSCLFWNVTCFVSNEWLVMSLCVGYKLCIISAHICRITVNKEKLGLPLLLLIKQITICNLHLTALFTCNSIIFQLLWNSNIGIWRKIWHIFSYKLQQAHNCKVRPFSCVSVICKHIKTSRTYIEKMFILNVTFEHFYKWRYWPWRNKNVCWKKVLALHQEGYAQSVNIMKNKSGRTFILNVIENQGWW